MRVAVGAGWNIVHLTDRCVELRKDDYAYRRLLGRDGFVRVRAEPGMSRDELITTAIKHALATDAELVQRVSADVFPTARGVAEYRRKQRGLSQRFGTPEDPEIIGRKAA
jgi:hypothetical protein